MRKSNDTKKMIYLQERALIDAIAADEAELLKRSVSSVIEENILNSILPHNKTAISFVRNFLYRDGNPDIKRAFEAIFSYLAGGIDFKATYPNARPIVSLYHRISIDAAAPTGKEIDYSYTLAQLGYIADRLERESVSNSQNYELKQAALHARELADIMEKEPQNIRLISISGMVLSSWEYLGNYTYTFRMLCGMAKLQQGIQDMAETRHELVEVLKQVSVEWND